MSKQSRVSKPLAETNRVNDEPPKRSARNAKIVATAAAAAAVATATQQSQENATAAQQSQENAKATRVNKQGRKRRNDEDAEDIPAQAMGSQDTNKGKKAKVAPKAQVRKGAKAAPEVEPDDLIDPLPELAVPQEGGALLAVGTGDIGQLGLGEDVPEKAVAGLVAMPEPIVDIMAGGVHTICLTNSGKVYTFGCNDDGALGRPTIDEAEQYIPGQVELPEKVVQVTAGDSHSAALTVTGKVYAWGNFRDNKGQMGFSLTHLKGTNLPVQIMPDLATQIASGSNHLICLGTKGKIYTCGNCEHGQLGRITPYNLERGGRRGLEDCLTPKTIRVRKPFDRIWAGTYTSFASTSESGEIYAFGLNNFKQLGHPTETLLCLPTKVTSFADRKWLQFVSGEHHTIALDAQGQVFSLGRWEYGRLGMGANVDKVEDCGVPTAIPTLAKIPCRGVGCGSLVSYAVAKTGEVYSWGAGTNNQLGHNSEDDQDKPKRIESKQLRLRNCLKVSAGGQHAVFIASDKE